MVRVVEHTEAGDMPARVAAEVIQMVSEEVAALLIDSEMMLRHCTKDGIDKVVEAMTSAEPDTVPTTVDSGRTCASRRGCKNSKGLKESAGREGKVEVRKARRQGAVIIELNLTYRLRWTSWVCLILTLARLFVMWLSPDVTEGRKRTAMTYVCSSGLLASSCLER